MTPLDSTNDWIRSDTSRRPGSSSSDMAWRFPDGATRAESRCMETSASAGIFKDLPRIGSMLSMTFA
eukprot:201277-Amorphochlora_amoeboformis.AAC.1